MKSGVCGAWGVGWEGNLAAKPEQWPLLPPGTVAGDGSRDPTCEVSVKDQPLRSEKRKEKLS